MRQSLAKPCPDVRSDNKEVLGSGSSVSTEKVSWGMNKGFTDEELYQSIERAQDTELLDRIRKMQENVCCNKW